ncbi:glycosyltransferase family 39 protein [Thioalkalivibrio sp. ALJ24]|uniref:ArnT family glycosyltransferase n=1 Tax=Thioalkalivibrio sp. ALJ24 TaxID=545276 RepID=UPI000379183B|nr:glycosyltransferase family 39 protein [Thioalkalivibrio sp. ALJ24]
MSLPADAPWPARHYPAVLLAVIALKALIAALLPITGDEAYFLVWAAHPDLGYYDHPPMIGWWLSAVTAVSEHPLVIRIPGILVSVAPALLILALWHRHDPVRARLVSLLALFMPLLFIAVLVATDTPLILFGLLATGLVWYALREPRPGVAAPAFFLGGVALGLAFLSKYFAVLLGVAIGLHIVLFAREHWRGLLLIILGVLPAVALNLYWNWDNCWYNVMFNVVNRHGGDGFAPGGTLTYAALLVYLFTPWLLWFLARQRPAVVQGVREHRLGVFVSAGLIPLGLFALLSPFAGIGLHWLAVFAPLLLVPALFLITRALRISVWLSGLLALLHALLLLAIATLPVDWLRGHGDHASAVFYLAPEEVAALTEPYADADRSEEDWHFFTRSYSRSAMLSHYSGHYFGVFGEGSHYGRQDDLITDFRALDGENFVFIPRRGEVDREDLEPFFDRVEIRTGEAGGIPWQVAEGHGFDYATYHEDVLRPVLERYYDIPAWLPEGRCAFRERYGTSGTP